MLPTAIRRLLQDAGCLLRRGRPGVMLLALVLASLAGAAPARAQGGDSAAMIVFDGSGSMWGKLGSERPSKLVAAREQLERSLTKVGPLPRLGLVTFGHRGGGCTDIELMQAPAQTDAARLLAPLERLNPRGRGPISQALRQAGQALADVKGPTSIILLADGADNCQQNVCQTAAQLKAAQPGLTIHLVALDMYEDDLEGATCIAKATGGKVIDASTLADLEKGLDDVVRTVASQAGLRPDRPAPPAAGAPAPKAVPKALAPDPPGLRLTAVLGPAKLAVSGPLAWRVTREGRSDEEPLFEADAVNPVVPLPAGRYVVEARSGAFSAKTTAEVGTDGRGKAELGFAAGEVIVKPVAIKGGDVLPDTYVSFAPADAESKPVPRPVVVSRDLTTSVLLAAGTYIVVAQRGLSRLEGAIKIDQGTTTIADLVMDSGDVAVTAAAREGGDLLDNVVFQLFEDDPDSPQGRREVLRSAGRRLDASLPAGLYYVIARHGQAEVRERVAVRAGQRTAKTLTLASGRLVLDARLPPALRSQPALADNVVYRIERLDGAQRQVFETSQPRPALDLAAGRYKVEARLGTSNARQGREIEVRPGVPQQVILEPAIGVLRLALLDSGGAALNDVFWEVRDRAGQTVATTTRAEPVLALAPGRYRVEAQHRQRTVRGEVEVRAGDSGRLDLSSQQ